MEQIKIIYMGTPEFAVAPLEALFHSEQTKMLNIKMISVVTQQDRPSGRGQKLGFSPVKQHALESGLEVWQPASLRDEESYHYLNNLKPDLVIVAAYGQILSKRILDIPRFGSINIHASLLPRFRGASPISEAIRTGDRETGITLMLMEKGLDTGPILAQRAVSIEDTDTTQSLTGKLSSLGAALLIETLPQWLAGKIEPQVQNSELATYTHQLKKEDGYIDWHLSAGEIGRLVRAMNPWPGAYTYWNGKLLKVHQAHVSSDFTPKQPGEVLTSDNKQAYVFCGSDVIALDVVQLEGKKSMEMTEFLRGYHLFMQATLGK